MNPYGAFGSLAVAAVMVQGLQVLETAPTRTAVTWTEATGSATMAAAFAVALRQAGH